MTASTPSFPLGQLWERSRPSLLHRLADGIRDGIRALDWPAECQWRDGIRGYSHAHYVMDIHSGHRCPRYRMADEYAAKARP